MKKIFLFLALSVFGSFFAVAENTDLSDIVCVKKSDLKKLTLLAQLGQQFIKENEVDVAKINDFVD